MLQSQWVKRMSRGMSQRSQCPNSWRGDCRWGQQVLRPAKSNGELQIPPVSLSAFPWSFDGMTYMDYTWVPYGNLGILPGVLLLLFQLLVFLHFLFLTSIHFSFYFAFSLVYILFCLPFCLLLCLLFFLLLCLLFFLLLFCLLFCFLFGHLFRLLFCLFYPVRFRSLVSNSLVECFSSAFPFTAFSCFTFSPVLVFSQKILNIVIIYIFKLWFLLWPWF